MSTPDSTPAIRPFIPGDPGTRSADLVRENIAQLQQLFPEASTEGRVDFDVLRQLLGDAVEDRAERYGLSWHGKRQARQLALTPSTGTLRPCLEESVDWDTTRNLVIEGDNLEVLKLLQKSYAGKVKLIYIDPPYNTGKDFVYADDYADSLGAYLRSTRQVDSEGRPLVSNTENSGRYHSDWLSMIYPRLLASRALLRENGVLLVSINDIEAPRLRQLLDELYGEVNFLCQFVWNNEGNVDQQSMIKGVHEYILAYALNVEKVARPTVIDPNIEETSKLYNDQIENSITKNGPANPASEVLLPAGFPAAFDSGAIECRDDTWPHIYDRILVEDRRLLAPARVKSGWSSKNLLELFIKNGCEPILDSSGKETWFAVTATGAIYGYKKRSDSQGHVLSVIRNVGTTKQNSSMLADWGVTFSYPKPVFLIQYLISVFTAPHEGDLILDFFAGSGTTGHAAIAQNAIDNGDRKFALIQLPARLDANDENRTLSALTRTRIRKAAAAVRTGSPLFAGDLGFRAYELDASNIRVWSPNAEDLTGTILASTDHILPGRTEQDLLFEILLKLGLELTVPIEPVTVHGKKVHAVGGGVLLVCLADSITEADAEPLGDGIVALHKRLDPAGDVQVVFRDSAFSGDVAKTNLAQILKQGALTNVRSI